MAGDREQCLAVGMNDHISKPIAVDRLLATLARWVGSAGPGPASALPADAPRPVLPGVNVADALQRMGDSLPRYNKLLARFSQHQTDAVPRIREALAQDAWDEAHRQAHTLKGLLATLGAEALARDALVAEQALRERTPAPLDALLLQLDAQLQPLLDAIAQWHAAHPPQTEAPASQEAQAPPTLHGAALQAVQAQLDQLAQRFAQDDSLALKLLAPLAQALQGSAHAAAFARVSTAAQDYDFPTALAALAPVRQALQAATDSDQGPTHAR